jgi:glutamate decarboxylase
VVKVALHQKVKRGGVGDRMLSVNPLYARGGESTEVPRFRLPNEPMLPETVYQIVRDELMLDGNARLNLATFVTTWMEPEKKQS